MLKFQKAAFSRQPEKMKGAALLEAVVSIGIFALGLLAIAGQQAKSVGDAGDVQYRAEAVHLVNAYTAKMWTMPMADGTINIASFQGGPENTFFQTEVTRRLPQGNATVVIAQDSALLTVATVTITLTWQPPGEDQRGYTQTSVIGRNAP